MPAGEKTREMEVFLWKSTSSIQHPWLVKPIIQLTEWKRSLLRSRLGQTELPGSLTPSFSALYFRDAGQTQVN